MDMPEANIIDIEYLIEIFKRIKEEDKAGKMKAFSVSLETKYLGVLLEALENYGLKVVS